MFNSIHESGLYSVEDKEVNMREMAFADSLDELSTTSTAGGPELSGECYNREYQQDFSTTIVIVREQLILLRLFAEAICYYS